MDKDLKVLPISDKIIKNYCGKTINFIEMLNFTFGKEMQLHVMEIKANQPFKTPTEFEETMQTAVATLNQIVQKHGANLLGTGMHPLLKLQDTAIWPHYHKKIYQQYGKIFNLNQHGWLNIQSFHLNLPFRKEADAIQTHNHLANLCTYLPAIAASSPIFKGKMGPDSDNRLQFYKVNQKEVPTVAGEVIPEYVSSLSQYKLRVIERYSQDLAMAGADKTLLHREWVNSRGVIFRFDRCALEVRVMDEQECVKADVALACFVRAALRGLIASNADLLPHTILVRDFNVVVKDGLNANVLSPHGKTARQVCQHYLRIATEHADEAEKKYLWLVKRRIEEGSLSDLIRANVLKRAQKTDFHEAVVDVYSTLIKCLSDNQPYS
ncbi:MAG: glutamate-cysteine ligase family protein [Chloroflexi bacterium]|nr:glutamate-cysteine ligase family protein [Chloroflexota bacterium]